MVRSMKPWNTTLLLALAVSLSGPVAWAGDEEETEEIPAHLRVEEAPPALRVEEPNRDPFHEQLALAANPQVPPAEAQQVFDELVARGAMAVPTLTRVFGDSRSGDQENWVAARALGRIGGEASRRALVSGLRSQRIITRLGAVSGLHLMGTSDSVAELEQALFDKAMTVRAAAADALGDIGNRKSSLALSKALNLPANFHRGKSHFVRLHIIHALGSIGSIGGIEALVSVLGEREPEITIAATVALETITGTSFKEMGSSDNTPPSAAEVAQWRTWWSQRSVGEIAE
jgi:HEAT repeat protein